MNLKKFLKAALCGAMVVAMAVNAGCGGGDKKLTAAKGIEGWYGMRIRSVQLVPTVC